MAEGTRQRFDIFSPGVGLVAIGAGLLSLAAVEGARLVLGVAPDRPGLVQYRGRAAGFRSSPSVRRLSAA